MRTLHIAAGSPYDAIIGAGALAHIEGHIKGRAFLASDENVAAPETLLERAAGVFRIPSGEVNKNHETLIALYEAMAQSGMERGDTVIGLGGGAALDIANFAAATYMRGLAFIACPTTLIAMADAALGGKCGVNIKNGKNLVGLVHQPSLVLSDTDMLKTLPEREYSSGMAEILKCGAIADRELFYHPGGDTEELIYRASDIKRKYVELDEQDTGARHILNFGHTLGHAYERASGFELSHGEAVAIGMVDETRLGELMGITEWGTADRIAERLREFSLPTRFLGARGDAVSALSYDKKNRDGVIDTVMLTRIGAVVYEAVPLAEFFRVLR